MGFTRELYHEELPIDAPPLDWHVRTYAAISSPQLQAPVMASIVGAAVFAGYMTLRQRPYEVHDTRGKLLLSYVPSPDGNGKLKGEQWFFDAMTQSQIHLKDLAEVLATVAGT